MSEDNNQLLERVINHVFENYDTDNCSDELLERIVDAVMEKMVKEDDQADREAEMYRKAQARKDAEIDRKNADLKRHREASLRVKKQWLAKMKAKRAGEKDKNLGK